MNEVGRRRERVDRERLERRFSDIEAADKHAIWRVICRHLQRYVDEESTVLDIACDRGYFVENIVAGERWATDIRDVSHHLSAGIRFVQADGLELDRVLPHGAFDVVFMSNYLEHLSSGEAVVEQLRVVAKLLAPTGIAMILQPNVRLLRGAYWDFIDHKVALTERSLEEAAELAGLRTVKLVKRFLPYTTKSRLPKGELVVRAYLALRPAWYVFGKQTLFLASPRS